MEIWKLPDEIYNVERRTRLHYMDALLLLSRIQVRLESIEKAGMYLAIPVESWESKTGGAKDYLYMLFKVDSNGKYSGPEGKRRVAVGRDPAKIAEARKMASNRAEWEKLTVARGELETWLQRQAHLLTQLEQSAAGMPQSGYELLK